MKRHLPGLLLLVATLLSVLPGCATPPAASDSFRFVQISDTQLGFSSYDADGRAFRRAVDRINALKPDFVIICGDLVNDAGNPPRAYPDFKEITAGFTMPVYCVPGNHDVGLPTHATAVNNYRAVIGPDNLSFDHHGWTFIGLNTQTLALPANHPEYLAQQTWLRQTLARAAAAKQPAVVFGHVPPFLATPDEKPEYFNYPQPVRREMLELYRANGVRAVISGHTHRQLDTTLDGMLFSCGGTTSVNFDQVPRGFNLWCAGPGRTLTRDYLPLEPPAPAKPAP